MDAVKFEMSVSSLDEIDAILALPSAQIGSIDTAYGVENYILPVASFASAQQLIADFKSAINAENQHAWLYANFEYFTPLGVEYGLYDLGYSHHLGWVITLSYDPPCGCELCA